VCLALPAELDALQCTQSPLKQCGSVSVCVLACVHVGGSVCVCMWVGACVCACGCVGV
jgi:hypothetical protein